MNLIIINYGSKTIFQSNSCQCKEQEAGKQMSVAQRQSGHGLCEAESKCLPLWTGLHGDILTVIWMKCGFGYPGAPSDFQRTYKQNSFEQPDPNV